MKKFQNKTVLITGASAGIGLALSREFAKEGAHLIITARREKRLQNLASELRAQHHAVLDMKCDVTAENDLSAVVSAGIQKFGKLDIVVANAGFGVAGNFESLKLEDYHRQFETNVFGVLRTAYAALEELKKTKGILVLIGSVNGYLSLPGNSPYGMSKFAVHALGQSLNAEFKPYGVSVVLIAPGFVETEIRQVDNLGKYHPEARDIVPKWLKMPADTAAKHILKAISQRKSEEVITLHGKCIVFLKRYFPGVLSFLVRQGLRGRPQPQ